MDRGDVARDAADPPASNHNDRSFARKGEAVLALAWQRPEPCAGQYNDEDFTAFDLVENAVPPRLAPAQPPMGVDRGPFLLRASPQLRFAAGVAAEIAHEDARRGHGEPQQPQIAFTTDSRRITRVGF